MDEQRGVPAEVVETESVAGEEGEPEVVAVERRLTRRERRLLLVGTPSTRRSAGALIVAIGALAVFIAVYWIPSHTVQVGVPGRPGLLTLILMFAVSLANFAVYGRRLDYLPGPKVTVPVAAVLVALSSLEIAWAVRYLRHAADSGYPDAVGPVTLIGAALVILGSLLAIGWRGVRSPRITPQAWAIAAAVLLGTLTSALIIGASANGWTVHATTAEAGTRAAVPASVSEVVWTRQLSAAGVAAGGPGLIVASGDTVSALGAADGSEVWTYRRSGAAIQRVVASPDGGTVYVELAEFDPDGHGTLVFDAMTGRLRFAANRPIAAGGRNVADAGVVQADTDATGTLRVVMRSGTDENGRWAFTGTPCTPAAATPQVLVTADRVVVAERCGTAPWRITALDAASGQRVWGITEPSPGGIRLSAAPDLGVAVITAIDGGSPRFRSLADGTPRLAGRQGYESHGLLVATDARNVPTQVVDPRQSAAIPLSAALQPVVDRSGTLLALDRQLLVGPAVRGGLRSIELGLVALPGGKATTLPTGLDPGDDLQLVAGPGAVFAVVLSGNGEAGVAALR